MNDNLSFALIACAVLAPGLAGCALDASSKARASTDTNSAQFAADSTAEATPPMGWDHRPEGDAWTEAALDAIGSHGAPLLAVEPADIERYCPAYPEADYAERSAFWAGLLSALAKHESTWREEAVGGGGQWFGLVQISPSTARGYGCQAKTGSALLEGEANLSCAVRIIAETVPRDGVVAQGMRGVAADWGPFHSSEKRAEMEAWTRTQPYCKG